MGSFSSTIRLRSCTPKSGVLRFFPHLRKEISFFPPHPNRWRYLTPETSPRGEAPRPLGGALRPRALGAAPREGVQPRSSEGAAGGLHDSDDDDDEKMEGKYFCFPQFKITNCAPKNKPGRRKRPFFFDRPFRPRHHRPFQRLNNFFDVGKGLILLDVQPIWTICQMERCTPI